MLPLVHPHQSVHNPHHLGGFTSFQNNITSGDSLQLQQQGLPGLSHPYQSSNENTRRPLPIRTAFAGHAGQYRSGNLLGLGHGNDSNEHQLRRKTPSGTIDAGYDGSPAGLAAGPPPLKQMAVPASSRIYPTAVTHHDAALIGHQHQASMPPMGWPTHMHHGNGVVSPGMGYSGSGNSGMGGGWISNQNMPSSGTGGMDQSAFLNGACPSQYNQVPRMQSVFAPMYQYSAGPTAFNPAGFTPPPVWRDNSAFEHHAQVPLSNLGYIPANAAFDSGYMPGQGPPSHTTTPGGFGLGSGYPLQMQLNYGRADGQFAGPLPSPADQMAPQRGLEALSLQSGSPVPGGNGLAQIHFKERALAHAHKTYADLLIYLSHTKKIYPNKHFAGLRHSSKMVVFPKPPKQLSIGLSPHQHKILPTYPNNGFNATPDRYGNFGQATGSGSSPAAVAFNIDRRHSGTTVVAQVIGHPALHKYPYSSKPYRTHPLGDMTSPLQNAKAALEMLTNLCGQSGWKWIDGMLLGGCLHYGLEHYEESLDWFKRIIGLDPDHVEAISNIAATLYCLNRHDEAEKHWIQAVKLRPSYLEAVEHLVGLLCSNHRNREAVATIVFVQDALRNQKPKLSRHQSADTASETSCSTAAIREATPDRYVLDADLDDPDRSVQRRNSDTALQPGFGSSGYAIPGNENGRMLLLVHAKGNMLYALKEVDQASEAFEEAVLISAGRNIQGLERLIRRIQHVLSPRGSQVPPSRSTIPQRAPSSPLLLPPEKAKHTAQLVFAANGGQLPGLRYVPEGSHRKSAISTTSNSLLSLAKIFQDALSNGGAPPGLFRQPSGVGDILALYYLSLSLQESPSTANNVGILLASVQQTAAQNISSADTPVSQPVPGIAAGSGLALALAYYNYGLNLDSKHVHLHTNLGSLLKDIGQLDLAIQMYERAVECDGTFDIALTNLANAVKDRGRIQDAISYYRRAVTSNPDFAEAVCGLSTALNSVCDWKGRGGVLLSGGRFDRWHVDDNGMLQDVKLTNCGGGLTKNVVDIVTRQLKESSTWGCGVLRESTLELLVSQLKAAGAEKTDRTLDLGAALRKWAGQSWEGSRLLRLVERSARSAMRTWYQDKYISGIESPGGYPRVRPPASLTVPSAPTVLPFHTFTCPLPAKDIRMISQRNALRISCSTLRSPWLPSNVYPPPPPPKPYLNIGYVSSDFNNHPLAHLMQSVFGFHNQSRAKAFCYATTASDRSVHRQQIEREAPVFRDVSNWSSDKLINQIVKDEIHILVNLNGYTRGARNEIFAARPAPIQMSFMGFAGTLGAEWCDYLLADSTAIPPSTLRPHRGNVSLCDVFRDEADAETEDWVYSENIVFCRDTFFCCDHAQSADADEKTMTWENEQHRRWKMRKELFPNLPDSAIILGNFNQLYKIDPTTFRTWLRILSSVPNAVLWLLRFPELGETNLKKTAAAWAGEDVARRIIFTDVAPKQQHIARARVCDLFLDTPECNAHTTAADVLWSSTPLLTLPRYEYKMCSRMAASILKGALPKNPEGEQAAKELIAPDELRYEQMVVKLAKNLSYRITKGGYGEGSGRLAELRKLLWKSKWSCALFDTRRWVRDLEDAYDEAWRRWVAGETGDIYL